MNADEINGRIAQLNAQIAEDEANLAHKVNRCRQLSAKKAANIPDKQRFVARLKTEIHQLTDEINNHKTELWDLQEMNLPGV